MLTDSRLGAAPHPSLTEHVHRIEIASELDGFQEYLEIDLAHVIGLEHSGALDRLAASKIVRALLRIAGPNPEAELGIDESQGSLLLQIEAYLSEQCGEAGGMLQLARSRIDQNAEAMRLIARRGALSALEAGLDLGRVLLEAAKRYDSLLAPGYTHLQHSQPSSLGHTFNAHYWMISRACERLEQSLERMDRSSLGGAALAGTDWPIDREFVSDLLGHPETVLNARDAGVFAVEAGAELAMDLGLLLSGLARIAGDLYFWSSTEVGLVRLDASLCGTSSMMPQKRNPYALERIRALAGEAVGWPATQLGILKMATTTDCDLVFTRNRVPEMCHTTVGAVELMSAAIATLEVDAEQMARSAGAHWSCASALADELVRFGKLSFRAAHEVVAHLVRLTEERGITAHDVGQAEFAEAVARSGQTVDVADLDVAACLDPESFLNSRTSAGGCAPEERARLAALAETDFAARRAHLDARNSRIVSARERLFAAARELAAG